MIIELPGLNGGSASKRYSMGFFHFSNNNLSIRKRCAEDLGKYDPKMLKSEDVDLCFRAGRDTHWVSCREPGVTIRHKARKTLFGLLRQMWGWGILLGRPYAKTGLRGLYLYWVGGKQPNIMYDMEIKRFPLLVCAFLTSFHLANLLGITAITLMLLGHMISAAVFGALAIVCAVRSLRDVFRAKLGMWETCKLAIIHYIANIVFITAAFLGGLRCGVILLPSSIFQPTPSAEFRTRFNSANLDRETIPFA